MKKKTLESQWHVLNTDEIAELLHADIENGLSSTNAQQRLLESGFNEVATGRRRSAFAIFASQFTDFMILILIAAAVISGLVGAPIDALTILVIVLLNAIVGAVQQYRADNAIAALKSMASPIARVLRNGEQQEISARELVSGDIIFLEAGDLVPADIRLISTEGLELNESSLTGESIAVSKSSDKLIDNDTILPERTNLGYKSSLVTRGRAKAIVVATGMQTEIGKIAALLGQQKTLKTPLQKRLTALGQRLALFVLAVCLLIFLAGLMRDEPILLMFLTAVSLAVAAIPEALPAIITVSLALGALKISRQFALVRNLPAVETLGSVSYICTDKTGTLTQNKMQLEKIIIDQQSHETIPDDRKNEKQWYLLGQALALNNDISIDAQDEIKGEPTELALYLSAKDNGFDKFELESSMPRLAELPFDSERKCMTTIHKHGSEIIAFTKGAPEAVLSVCQHQLANGEIQAIERDSVLEQAEQLASDGYRVLAIACRNYPELPLKIETDNVEAELVFVGLVGLLDPPRDEAKAAVAECIAAGITPVMITGDHLGTALAIAKRLGIASEKSISMTGRELADLSMEDFEQQVERIRVYARVSPEQKTKIVKALQDKGQFIAMTGDGVNDAPALKRSDIGIAMGRKGTAVAREAADMVLLDDNFATIVAAVHEGRRIFDNIKKFIKYTMTSNTGEILTLFLAPFMGLPIPLLPIHILWINLVTDGLPGLALSMEPAERRIMQRPPRPPGESIFAGGLWQHMIWVGFVIAALSIFSQAWALDNGSENWQTIVFTVLTFSQLVNVMVIRSETESIFTIGLFTNMPLLGAVVLTIALQLAIIYIPFFNDIFKTSPLSWHELAMCFALPFVILIVVEIEKWFFRRRSFNNHREIV